MGSFVFKWNHPATEVYVTGTFDDWKKTEKLEKTGDGFEKTVFLPGISSNILYKFVVDGEWVIDHTAPKETDGSGNENNVLSPERIISEVPPTTAIMSSAAPLSSTAGLAADAFIQKETTPDSDVKGEKTENSNLPGSFPETPAADNNVETTFGVNPLPAAAGAVNPVQLAPGETVPEDVHAQDTTSHVKLDPESYEKSDSLPGVNPFTISSAAPVSTTAALAADAPLEHKQVPDVVKESQEKVHASPEASAVPEEVDEKAAVEKELLDRVKEAPSTSEGTAGKGTEKTEGAVTPGEAAASVVAAASAAAGAAVVGAYAAKDTAIEKTQDAYSAAQPIAASAVTSAAAQLPASIQQQLPESVQNAIGTTQKEEVREEVSPEAPTQVKESITAAGESPEAAANTEAVEEKKAVESALLKEVKTIDASANGEPPREEIASDVPSAVQDSIAASGRSPEAATNAEAVENKKAVDNELTNTVEKEIEKDAKTTELADVSVPKEAAVTEAPSTNTTSDTKTTPALAVPATTEAPATSVAAPTTETPAATESKATEETKATNGTNAATAPTTPSKPTEVATPASSKASESTATNAEKKKKNRLSAMFGKVKAKLSSKN
ncbi:hypothetical protein F4808DRAFT_86950 [Astrocystis sublimbata]|nr:hypothetical protein F4808DRAFT_86950 [Astrocystis sublimbata]